MDEKRTVLDLYTVKELIEKFGGYYKDIVNNKNYIPVKIKDSKNQYAFKQGKIKKDYSIKYVLRKDIEKYIGSLEKTKKGKEKSEKKD